MYPTISEFFPQLEELRFASGARTHRVYDSLERLLKQPDLDPTDPEFSWALNQQRSAFEQYLSDWIRKDAGVFYLATVADMMPQKRSFLWDIIESELGCVRSVDSFYFDRFARRFWVWIVESSNSQLYPYRVEAGRNRSLSDKFAVMIKNQAKVWGMQQSSFQWLQQVRAELDGGTGLSDADTGLLKDAIDSIVPPQAGWQAKYRAVLEADIEDLDESKFVFINNLVFPEIDESEVEQIARLINDNSVTRGISAHHPALKDWLKHTASKKCKNERCQIINYIAAKRFAISTYAISIGADILEPRTALGDRLLTQAKLIGDVMRSATFRNLTWSAGALDDLTKLLPSVARFHVIYHEKLIAALENSVPEHGFSKEQAAAFDDFFGCYDRMLYSPDDRANHRWKTLRARSMYQPKDTPPVPQNDVVKTETVQRPSDEIRAGFEAQQILVFDSYSKEVERQSVYGVQEPQIEWMSGISIDLMGQWREITKVAWFNFRDLLKKLNDVSHLDASTKALQEDDRRRMFDPYRSKWVLGIAAANDATKAVVAEAAINDLSLCVKFAELRAYLQGSTWHILVPQFITLVILLRTPLPISDLALRRLAKFVDNLDWLDGQVGVRMLHVQARAFVERYGQKLNKLTKQTMARLAMRARGELDEYLTPIDYQAVYGLFGLLGENELKSNLIAGEPWVDAMLVSLSSMSDSEAKEFWNLLQWCSSVGTKKLTKARSQELQEFESTIGNDRLLECLSHWIYSILPGPNEAVFAKPNIEILAGFVHVLATIDSIDICNPLAHLAQASYEKVPNGPRSEKVGNMCVEILAGKTSPANYLLIRHLRLLSQNKTIIKYLDDLLQKIKP